MSADVRAARDILVRVVAACQRPLREWSDDDLQGVTTYSVDELARVTDPRESEAMRAVLAGAGIYGAEAEAKVSQLKAESIRHLIEVLTDVHDELERRHPERVLTEPAWRAHLAALLGPMITRARLS